MSMDIFHPIVTKWFQDTFEKPTDIQAQAWKSISQENHVLISAPTGSGKTLTAFLFALNQLITGAWQTGQLRVVYVSPLKALNNDIRKNLMHPLFDLQRYFERANEPFPKINVLTRSGDTPQNERRQMAKKPPEILITTPESLNILLTTQAHKTMFAGLTTVIIDEIHALVNEKRGVYLMTAIERLTRISGEFQRIAISATVKPMKEVAQFVGGYRIEPSMREGDDAWSINKDHAMPPESYLYHSRQVECIQSTTSKEYNIKVDFPAKASLLDEDKSWWDCLIAEFLAIIKNNRSTLFFTNNRRQTEKIARLLNETYGERIAYAHHGSLSKEIRLSVEQKLKRGELKAIVATNSLELGIDIGELDEVVLVQAPWSIASGIQRIGRAGHQVGQPSMGTLFPIYPQDLINGAVQARAILDQAIESVKPIRAPLDLLAQIILAMTYTEPWDKDALFAFLKCSYSYHDLQQNQFEWVLQMLAGKYAQTRIRELNPVIAIDAIDNTIQAKSNAKSLLYISGGTIPDRGYYNLRHQNKKVKIGELDEEFVWERNIGEKFALGTQIWQIQRITESDVEVVPANHAHSIIPFWKADGIQRNHHFSDKISCFMEDANKFIEQSLQALCASENNAMFMEMHEWLCDTYCMTSHAATALIELLQLQREETESALPHRHHVLAEHFDDPFNKSDTKQVILHTFWGGAVNRPFGIALSSAWEEKYQYPLEVFVNDDCVLLMLPHAVDAQHIFEMVSSRELEKLLRNKLERTGLFGAIFRENAGRALLLPKASFKKRLPFWLNRLRSKKLLDAVLSFEDFPIIIETWRTCLHDIFDLESLKQLLDEIQDGVIHISDCITQKPSQLASNIIWRQTNKYMYEGDEPLSGKTSNLMDSILHDMMHGEGVMPKIPESLIMQLDKKLKRTEPGYAPTTELELLEWIKERICIPESEWKDLEHAIQNQAETPFETLMEKIKKKVVWFRFPQSSTPVLIALEVVPTIIQAFELDVNNIQFADHSNIHDNNDNNDNDDINDINHWDSAAFTQSIIHKIQHKLPNIPHNQDDITQDDLAYPSKSLTAQSPDIGHLAMQWLACYPPVALQEIKEIFGACYDRLEDCFPLWMENQQIVMGLLSDSTVQSEVCTSETMEIALRMLRKSMQPAFEPLSVKELLLAWARYHGCTQPGDSVQQLQHTLDVLTGYTAPAELWETAIFPARLEPYYPIWLDGLFHSSDLIWFGDGKQKVGFAFPEDLQQLLCELPGIRMANQDMVEQTEHMKTWFPSMHELHSVLKLSVEQEVTEVEAVSQLWEWVWLGMISNDSFETLRKGIRAQFDAHAFKEVVQKSYRMGRSRWENQSTFLGNWFRLNWGEPMDDPVEYQELQKEKVRIVLQRYGILFKELLARELPIFQWRDLFKTLRLMEFSGEVQAGFFFEGIADIQFISPSFKHDLLKSHDNHAIFWINACDPISPCGLKLHNLGYDLPKRIPSNYLVFKDTELAITIEQNGKKIVIHLPLDDPHLLDCLTCLRIVINRAFDPIKRIQVHTINDTPALKSPYRDAFRQMGFSSGYKFLELHKKI